MQTLNTLERDSIPAQAVVMTIFRKPGFLDRNAEVIALKLEAIKFLAQKSDFSTRSAAMGKRRGTYTTVGHKGE